MTASRPVLHPPANMRTLRPSTRSTLFLAFTIAASTCIQNIVVVSANDNGLALTPPMGWRSWNQYGGNVDQVLMQLIMDGMVDRGRTDHNGQPTSLCGLGYCDVGLDDNWQDCGSANAAPGMHYHDIDGNPIVDLKRFPDLRRMTAYAHSLNLTAGFYGNNCICSDHCRNDTECDLHIQGDTKALVGFDFDSWKLDGCGGENDMASFDRYIRKMANRPVLVESCHWGVPKYDPDPNLPPRQGCPWNFYRSSGDIQLSYSSVLWNLASVERYRAINASVPSCWAYPDMLQIGIRRRDDGTLGLNRAESRSHFGAWCIVSSPLFLGHDVNDEEVNDAIWDIISNREAIAVNQAYAGDSGGVYETSSFLVHVDVNPSVATSRNRHLRVPGAYSEVPSYRYLSKPLGGGKVAVLLMNCSREATKLTAKFSDVAGLSCNDDTACRCKVRNIWTHKDEGSYDGSWSTIVAGHDAAFIIVEAI
mmetsp:Transcript_9845/g.20892  ORF Transcript_9845/g.20892 Transcript_9845/m.20892 type:complete len:476 (-) Transcript_9845:1269-2696(-)